MQLGEYRKSPTRVWATQLHQDQDQKAPAKMELQEGAFSCDLVFERSKRLGELVGETKDLASPQRA